jgi:maleate isomerase
MPSFQSVQQVENSLGLPVTTAAISTVYQMLKSLGLERKVENAGALLSGRF